MDWVTRLLGEYKEGHKQARKHYNSLEKDDPERKVVGSMYRDMNFVIEWLETGRMPGKMKGIDKTDAYKISLGERQPKTAIGLNGYWDESIGAFVTTNNYKNQYEEVEDRIDAEIEQIKKGRVRRAKSRSS